MHPAQMQWGKPKQKVGVSAPPAVEELLPGVNTALYFCL